MTNTESETPVNPLRQWREDAKLSQSALADLLTANNHEVTRAAIHYWERGGRVPQLVDVEAIGKVLGKKKDECERAFLLIHRLRSGS